MVLYARLQIFLIDHLVLIPGNHTSFAVTSIIQLLTLHSYRATISCTTSDVLYGHHTMHQLACARCFFGASQRVVIYPIYFAIPLAIYQ